MRWVHRQFQCRYYAWACNSKPQGLLCGDLWGWNPSPAVGVSGPSRAGEADIPGLSLSLISQWNSTPPSPGATVISCLHARSQGFPGSPRYKKCVLWLFLLTREMWDFSGLWRKFWLLHKVWPVGIFLGSVFWTDLHKINQISSLEFNPSSPQNSQTINSWALYYYTHLSSIAMENSLDILDKLQILIPYTLE